MNTDVFKNDRVIRESAADIQNKEKNEEKNDSNIEEKLDAYRYGLLAMVKTSKGLLDFINSRSKHCVTHDDVLAGVFPWNKPQS